MTHTRREFLKLMAASTGAVLFAGCGKLPPGIPPKKEFLIQSPVTIPEDFVTGTDNWYATLCRQCSAGCGILVRIVEGRAKKIEGNPNHPINGSKHCARAEAALQGLYHPDRLLGPMRRTGKRGSGRFESITWDDALNELVGRLRGLQGKELLAITEPMRGHQGLIVDRFVRSLRGSQMVFEPSEHVTLRRAVKQLFGQDRLPDFEIDGARYLVSFGADFLSTWLSPVRYGIKYGEFRHGRSQRGTFVQVDPRFSMSAANADVWIPIRPGTEGILALSMIQAAASEGLGDAAALQAMTGGGGAAALDAFRPEQVAGTTNVAADRIRRLARDFATIRPSLAIGGGPAAAQTNGFFNLQAIYALNFLVGSVGTTGGLRFNPPAPIPDIPSTSAGTSFADWQRAAQQLQTNQPQAIDVVLVHDANPVYGLPSSLKFGDALTKAPYIVSFSRFMDETTALADLIMPDHHFLEDWGDDVPDPGPGYEVLGVQQPVVMPVGNTRGFADVLLTVAEELGGNAHQALPWNTMRDAVRDGASKLQALNRGSVVGSDFEQFWVTLLQRGVWWGASRASQAAPGPAALPRQPQAPAFAGPEREYPFYLIPFASNSLMEGQAAHLPWLQALPDPTSTVVWQSWVEVNPTIADKMGIATGDIVAVESPSGRVEVPAYVHPATPPDVAAMPAGQGHWNYTRYASGRGSNPFGVVAPQTDSATGALASAATRVKITKTGRHVDLPKFEGTVPAYQLPDAPVVPVVKS